MPVQTEDLVWVGLVSLAHAWQQGQAATEVANLRRKHKIMPPVTDGPPDFIRALRAQQNCLEFGVSFQIVLWTGGLFCHQVPAALLGAVYLYARHRYIKGYIEEADKRLPGFWMSIRALKGLTAISLAGVTNHILIQYANINIPAMVMTKGGHWMMWRQLQLHCKGTAKNGNVSYVPNIHIYMEGLSTLTTATATLEASAVPNFTQYVAVGRIDDPELNEASGIAASRKFQDILYTHNDHGDRPRLFAINATNAHVVAILEISPAKHYDWEDLAVGPCSDGSSQTCIYVLDDGRYRGQDQKTVYKIAEPDALIDQTLTPDSVLTYNWTEPGSNTLMVDPMGEVYIIANVYGGRGMIINLPKSAWGQTNPVFVESGSFYAMYSSSHTDPEGGDISPDGSEILIKIANHLYYYAPVNMDFISSLTHPGIEVPYHRERLGEAVCWSADGRSYFTLGEDTGAVLYRYDKQ